MWKYNYFLGFDGVPQRSQWKRNSPESLSVFAKRENLSSIISYILVKRIGGILDWSQICYIVELDDVLDLCTVKKYVETLRFSIDCFQLSSTVTIYCGVLLGYDCHTTVIRPLYCGTTALRLWLDCGTTAVPLRSLSNFGGDVEDNVH